MTVFLTRVTIASLASGFFLFGGLIMIVRLRTSITVKRWRSSATRATTPLARISWFSTSAIQDLLSSLKLICHNFETQLCLDRELSGYNLIDTGGNQSPCFGEKHQKQIKARGSAGNSGFGQSQKRELLNISMCPHRSFGIHPIFVTRFKFFQTGKAVLCQEFARSPIPPLHSL